MQYTTIQFKSATIQIKYHNRIEELIHFCRCQLTDLHGLMPTDQLHE